LFPWFCLEYTIDVLEEAKLYSIHAGRKQVELEDIKLACQNWAEEHSTMPSKDVKKTIISWFKPFKEKTDHRNRDSGSSIVEKNDSVVLIKINNVHWKEYSVLTAWIYVIRVSQHSIQVLFN